MTATTSTPRRTAAQTRALVLDTLAEAATPVTVTELAEAAGLGKSTLGTHLPALEKDGKALRTPGGRDGRRRLPDLWQAEPNASVEQDTGSSAESSDQETDPTSEEGSGETDPARDPAPKVPAPPERSGGKVSTPESAPRADSGAEATTPAHGQDTSHGQHTPAPPVPTAPSAADVAEPDLNPVSGSTRLAPGELKVMVMALLDADPAEEFTATALSHQLAGRSIGAIQNNLARLAKEGRAQQTCDKPRRYRSAKHPA